MPVYKPGNWSLHKTLVIMYMQQQNTFSEALRATKKLSVSDYTV